MGATAVPAARQPDFMTAMPSARGVHDIMDFPSRQKQQQNFNIMRDQPSRAVPDFSHHHQQQHNFNNDSGMHPMGGTPPAQDNRQQQDWPQPYPGGGAHNHSGNQPYHPDHNSRRGSTSSTGSGPHGYGMQQSHAGSSRWSGSQQGHAGSSQWSGSQQGMATPLPREKMPAWPEDDQQAFEEPQLQRPPKIIPKTREELGKTTILHIFLTHCFLL